MRQVKCRDTGEFKPKNEAYKDPDKGQYYSSEEAYIKIKENNEYRNKCYDYFVELLELKYGQPVPRSYLKKLNSLSAYGFDVIYETLLRQEQAMRWALENKDFDNDYQSASYIFAIIDNNIRNVSEEFERKRFIQRREVKDRDDDSGQELQQGKQKVSDISKFVGDIDD